MTNNYIVLTSGAASQALNGVIYVKPGDPSPTLSATMQCASCDTLNGSVPTIYLPINPTPGMMVAVWDDDSNAAGNHITVTTHAGNIQILDPTGNYLFSATLATSNMSVIWCWDPSLGGFWQIVSMTTL